MVERLHALKEHGVEARASLPLEANQPLDVVLALVFNAIKPTAVKLSHAVIVLADVVAAERARWR